MLLFKEYHVPLILVGKKTQTRRPCHNRQSTRRPCIPGKIHQVKLNYRKDSIFAHLKILSVEKTSLADISLEDAKAEGYDSIYFKVWKIEFVTTHLDGVIWREHLPAIRRYMELPPGSPGDPLIGGL